MVVWVFVNTGSGIGWVFVGTKYLPEPIVTYHQLDLLEHISMTFYWNWDIFVQWNVFEDVICKVQNPFNPKCLLPEA